MRNIQITLPISVSDGPKRDDRGYIFQDTACPGCHGEIEQGEEIVQFGPKHWYHTLCVTPAVEKTAADRAWTMLARQAARRPSEYTATTLRAILENVANLAEGTLSDAGGL